MYCLYVNVYCTTFSGCQPNCSLKNIVLYRVDPPDDEQEACSKHVEAYY